MKETFMPKYELMYILSASVSDDQVPQATEQIKQIAADFGATEIVETQLGKKKLAYTIKKTKNGHYVVLNFEIPTSKINQLDAKIRTQTANIVRYLIVNLEEHLKRTAKDAIIQSSLPKRQIPDENAPEPVSAPAPKKPAQPVVEINEEELEKKIEAALTEDITK